MGLINSRVEAVALEIPLLDSLAQIDAAWLEAVMRAAGHAVHINDFTFEPIGAGNVSDTVRILIDADGAGPRAIIAKFRPLSETAQSHAVASGAYRCEGGAYRLLMSQSDGCRIPRILWLRSADNNINLVMEDLSQVSRAGSQIAGCSLRDAAAVTTQLARLHRAFFPLASTQAPDWLLRMRACGDYWAPITERGATVVESRLHDRISDEYLRTIREAAPLSRLWHDSETPAMTVTHGDPRADNILFDDRGPSPEAILIDWQVTGLRNPMHDLGYFISTSLCLEARRAHERSLLDPYLEEFGRGRGYAVDRMLDDYRVQLVAGLMTVIAAGAVLPDDERANHLLQILLERTCSAVIDWQSLDALRALG